MPFGEHRDIDNSPAHLYIDEIADPKKVIARFFSTAPLPHYRKCISGMLQAAYDNDFWKKNEPGSLLLVYENVERLIEAAYLINNNSIDDEKSAASIITDETIIKQDTIDPLLYCGWQVNSTTWDFFPRHISKKEFLNPYIVFTKFFSRQNLASWRDDWHEVFFYSMISDSSDRSGVDVDYLGMHKHLQKLIEAAHLIDVREIDEIDGLQKHKFKKQTPAANEPAEIINSESSEPESQINTNIDKNDSPKNPYDLIEEFFGDGDLEDGKRDLSCLFEAGFSIEIIERDNYPVRLLFSFQHLEKLIEATYSIYLKIVGGKTVIRDLQEDHIIARLRLLNEKLQDWELFPCKLKLVEWLNPQLAIQAFFEHDSLSHWKDKLHDFVQASVTYGTVCECMEDSSTLYEDCVHLEKLIEATWLIKVLEIQNTD